MAQEFGNDDEIVAPTLPEFGHGDDVVVDSGLGVAPTAAERQAATTTRARLLQLRDELDADLAAPKYRVGIKIPGMDSPLVSAPIPAELAAFGSEAAKSLAPTGAGLAAASAVTPYSNTAANALQAIPGYGRVISPVVRFGAPLAAGAIAGLGTRLAQDEALPNILPEDAAQSYELTSRLAAENPNSAMLGQFAGAGPFFRPGLPVNSVGNARLATPLIAGGIGGGIEGAQQIASGDFDPQRLAIATAGSALLNRETALGRRLGPNLVLPDIAGGAPEELATMGRVLREPVLPEPTNIAPTELSAVANANQSAAADIAGAAQAGTTVDDIRIRRLAERMAGKLPDQQLDVLNQEIKLAGDTLTPAEERAALDMKQALEDQIARGKAQEAAAKEAQAAADAQQKAVEDAQKAAQLAVPEAPPQVAKSTQIIEEANAPKSLANAAAIGAKQAEGNLTQLQTQINQTAVALPKITERAAPVEATAAPLQAPVEADSKPAQIKQAVDAKDTEYVYTVQRPFTPGGKGFIQVDAINPLAEGMERNVVSSNPADLRKAGADIPDVPDWVPQGQYALEQIKQFIKTGEPKNAIPIKETASEVLRPQGEGSGGVVELPRVEQGNGPAEAPRETGSPPSQAEPIRLDNVSEGRLVQLADQLGIDTRKMSGDRLRARIESNAHPDQIAEALAMQPPPDNLAGRKQGSRMRQTRGASTPKALLPLAGGGAGGIVGFVATDQEPGESDSEFAARRLRNAALGTAVGAGGGIGINALARGAQALERSRLKADRSGRVAVPEAPEGQGVRRTAEKIIENRQYPEALRQTLADDPDILYNKFALNDLADKVSAATEAELVQMRGSTNIRDRIGATAELANRLSLSPDPELQKQGAALYSEVAQSLTDPAQLLGLGKLVKTPQGFVTAINEKLKDVNRVLSPQQDDALRRLATESIKSEQELAAASRAAETDFTQANEAAYRAAQKKNADSKKALDEFVHRVSPEGWDQLLSKTIQGNLLTPLSLVANVFGNVAYQPVRRAASSFATALDAIYSVSTGRERTMARLNPIPAYRELSAAAEGIKIAGKELLTGPSSDSYIKGEVQRGFRPLRSLVQAFTGKDLAVRPDGTVALGDRAKKLYEGLVGIPPEAMFRFLSLGDKPLRRAAEAELLVEQGRLKGLKGRALERFYEFPDKATQELINTEGRRAIFAQDNKFATRLNGFLDHGLAEAVGADKIPALKGALKVFGRLVVPFRQFPLNYVNTALNFAAPELATAKAIYHASKGDRRKALQNLGEGTLGVMMYGAANYLWNKNLISEPTDKDAKARSVQYEQMGPQRINISGLNRAMDGGDGSYRIGDLTMDWGRLGIPSANMYVFTRNAAKGRKDSARTGENRNPETTPATAIGDRLSAFPGMASFALDQSFLSGTSALLDAMRNPDPEGQEFQNWASNTFRAVTSIPVPNTVEALARAQYQYIPELKGDNLTETLANTWRYKTLQVPDADRALLKRGLWGEPISRTTPGENPYITQFVDVTRAQRKEGDPFKRRLVDLYKITESPDVYPQLPTRNISVDGITAKLTPEDYDRYQKFVGAARLKYAQQIVDNPRFLDGATIPEAKILALEEAYKEGAKIGKQQLLALPGVAKKYFPELVGQPIAPPDTSRVVSRDAKARGRLREMAPAFGADDATVP